MKPEATEYVLRLRPLNGDGWRTAPAQRLKLALKRLVRDYGLRCTECRPSAPEAQDDEQPEETKATE